MWKRIKIRCIVFFNYARSGAIKSSLGIKGDEQKRLSISSRNLLYKNRPTIRSAVLITTEVRICVPVNCYIMHGNHLAPEYPCCILEQSQLVWLETKKPAIPCLLTTAKECLRLPNEKIEITLKLQRNKISSTKSYKEKRSSNPISFFI